jgi:hypothetical protein
MNITYRNYKQLKDTPSSILILPIEFRPDGYAYAIIPLKHGFVRYTRLCKSSRIADILQESNLFSQFGGIELD